MKYFIVVIICISISLAFLSTKYNKATYLFTAEEKKIQGMYFPNEIQLPDPTGKNQAIYGTLKLPYGVNSYFFIPHQKEIVAIEALVPKRLSNQSFRPAWEIIGPNISPQPMNIEFSVPTDSHDIGHDYMVTKDKRSIVFDTESLSLLYRGNRQEITVLPGRLYYLNIYEPLHYTGDYVIRITHDDQQSLPQLRPILYTAIGWDRIDTNAILAILGCLFIFSSISLGLALSISTVFLKKIFAKLYLAQLLFFVIYIFGLICLEKITYSLIFSGLQYLFCIGGVVLCLFTKSSVKPFILKILFCIWMGELLTVIWYLCVLH